MSVIHSGISNSNPTSVPEDLSLKKTLQTKKESKTEDHSVVSANVASQTETFVDLKAAIADPFVTPIDEEKVQHYKNLIQIGSFNALSTDDGYWEQVAHHLIDIEYDINK